MQAVRQVATLMDGWTVRTLPSPRPTGMPPGWNVWVTTAVQSGNPCNTWNVMLPEEKSPPGSPPPYVNPPTLAGLADLSVADAEARLVLDWDAPLRHGTFYRCVFQPAVARARRLSPHAAPRRYQIGVLAVSRALVDLAEDPTAPHAGDAAEAARCAWADLLVPG